MHENVIIKNNEFRCDEANDNDYLRPVEGTRSRLNNSFKIQLGFLHKLLQNTKFVKPKYVHYLTVRFLANFNTN